MTRDEIVNTLRGQMCLDDFPWCVCEGYAVCAAAADLIENQQRHIEALMQANDALRERQRWIPVEEQRPTGDGHYLCRYGFGGKAAFYQTLDYYATDVQPHFQHEGMRGMRVTHWMPLPEAPEVE